MKLPNQLLFSPHTLVDAALATGAVFERALPLVCPGVPIGPALDERIALFAAACLASFSTSSGLAATFLACVKKSLASRLQMFSMKYVLP